MRVRPRFLAALVVAGAGALIAAAIFLGSELVSPAQTPVGDPPRGFDAEAVHFPSRSGADVNGWLFPRPEGSGAVVLLHGIRSSRLGMLPRARFLWKAGYTILLFDLQANGETIGRHQTFGWLESLDARAAVGFLRSRRAHDRVGVDGASLGGAAAVLGPEPIEADALVLEEVYPTIEEATANRIGDRFGAMGRLLTPLLLAQLHLRLGIAASDLRPIDRMGRIRAPLLVIAGEKDPYTPPAESRRLFDAAPEPKIYWEVPGAGHVDFHAHAPAEYEKRILDFFARYLGGHG